MKELKYRNTSYFNSEDNYLYYDAVWKKYVVTRLQKYNGNWYTVESLEIKMTSLICINCKEIHGQEVIYPGTTLRGKITKSVRLNLGVNWYQGENYKKYGLPYFWNDPNIFEGYFQLNYN